MHEPGASPPLHARIITGYCAQISKTECLVAASLEADSVPRRHEYRRHDIPYRLHGSLLLLLKSGLLDLRRRHFLRCRVGVLGKSASIRASTSAAHALRRAQTKRGEDKASGESLQIASADACAGLRTLASYLAPPSLRFLLFICRYFSCDFLASVLV